jgi:hypothetical protein
VPADTERKPYNCIDQAYHECVNGIVKKTHEILLSDELKAVLDGAIAEKYSALIEKIKQRHFNQIKSCIQEKRILSIKEFNKAIGQRP